jgi:hypothetical protein
MANGSKRPPCPACEHDTNHHWEGEPGYPSFGPTPCWGVPGCGCRWAYEKIAEEKEENLLLSDQAHAIEDGPMNEGTTDWQQWAP